MLGVGTDAEACPVGGVVPRAGQDVAKDMNFKNLWSKLTHHIIDILPVVQRDELKRRQHGPHEVVEVGVPVVGVGPDAEAGPLGGAVPRAGQVAADYRDVFVVYHPV